MKIETALKKLYSLHQFGIKLGLQNISELLDHIGNPQKNLKTVHIAGSNGKGSTAAFMASILSEAGFKVGLYTSPHFVRFNERIRIGKEEISDSEITRFMERLDKYIDEKSPTFFELTTALAFDHFSKNGPDICVIETGLGGRLDATNVINPLASVITSIGFEHTNILGDTIEKIAAEKGGIIKSGTKVILGNINTDAEKVLSSIASAGKCELILFKDCVDLKEDHALLEYGALRLNIYDTPLRGSHQISNASLASLALAGTLGIDDPVVYLKGIKNVYTNSGIQGRYEIHNLKPMVIFDSAHNLDGVNVFLSEFKREIGNYNKKILIFGVMRDKDIKNMILDLSGSFDEIYFTEIDYERSAKTRELLNIASELDINASGLENPAAFINKFKASDSADCLVVLGSMYLLGAVKEGLIEKSS